MALTCPISSEPKCDTEPRSLKPFEFQFQAGNRQHDGLEGLEFQILNFIKYLA